MSNTTSLNLADGTTATVDHDLLQEYRKRIFSLYQEADGAKEEVKEEIEALAFATKIPKAMLNKYMKASYKADIAKSKEAVELFEALDQIVKA